jgi:hypothetical protein
MVLGQWKVHYYLVQFRRCGCCCGCCLLEILFSVGFMLSVSENFLLARSPGGKSVVVDLVY